MTQTSDSKLDLPVFMRGLCAAQFNETDCVKCYGRGAVGIKCCSGHMCGCHGWYIDFDPFDCGVDFPSDEQIEKWSKKL